MGVEEWGGGIRDNMKKKKFSILLMVLISFSVNLVWSQELKKDSTIINLLLKNKYFVLYFSPALLEYYYDLLLHGIYPLTSLSKQHKLKGLCGVYCLFNIVYSYVILQSNKNCAS